MRQVFKTFSHIKTKEHFFSNPKILETQIYFLDIANTYNRDKSIEIFLYLKKIEESQSEASEILAPVSTEVGNLVDEALRDGMVSGTLANFSSELINLS